MYLTEVYGAPVSAVSCPRQHLADLIGGTEVVYYLFGLISAY